MARGQAVFRKFVCLIVAGGSIHGLPQVYAGISVVVSCSCVSSYFFLDRYRWISNIIRINAGMLWVGAGRILDWVGSGKPCLGVWGLWWWQPPLPKPLHFLPLPTEACCTCYACWIISLHNIHVLVLVVRNSPVVACKEIWGMRVDCGAGQHSHPVFAWHHWWVMQVSSVWTTIYYRMSLVYGGLYIQQFTNTTHPIIFLSPSCVFMLQKCVFMIWPLCYHRWVTSVLVYLHVFPLTPNSDHENIIGRGLRLRIPCSPMHNLQEYDGGPSFS